MIVGAILQCAAYSLAMFTVGRVICGVGNGINTSTVPVWQSECSKPHHRGRTVAFDLSLVIIGVAIAYWVDFGMSYTEPSAVAWRFPIAFQRVFALVVVGWILFLPESPRWLVLRGRDDEGLQVLSAIYNVPMDHPIAQENLQAIKSTVLLNDSTGYRDIFTSGPERHFHRTILGCIAQMMQQLTGINVIAYYQTSIYQNQLNLGPLTSRLLAGCTSTVFWLSTIPPIFVIDRVGRRKLVLFSSGGMLVCLCFMAGMMSHTTRGTGIVAAVMIFLYNFFYSSGWNLFGWLYPSEILPITIRAQGNALTVTSNWLFAFMVVMVTPVMFNSLGWKTYIVYAAFNAVMLPVIHFFYPETSCRSLEEMDVIFAKSRNAFDTVQVAKSQP
jgi:sugar porter (SP) family MFS transporter